MLIAYVHERYPLAEQGEIVDEILQLESRGADLVILASHDSEQVLRNPEVDRIRASVHYLRSTRGDIFRLLRGQARLLASFPALYAAAATRPVRDGSLRREARLFLEAGRLACLALDGEVDHLHAPAADIPATLAFHAAMLSGIPFSFAATATDVAASRRSAVARKAAYASFVTVPTIADETYLRRILPRRYHGKLVVVSPGVDTASFHPRVGHDVTSVPSIISVGRLVPEKGHAHLIDAAALLRDEGTPFRLYIYGSGPQRDALRKQISESGLQGHVYLRGECSREQLAEAYRQADVFVLVPGQRQADRLPLPTSLLEAMSSGLPPVVSWSPRVAEVVADGANGLIADTPEPGRVASALKMLLHRPSLRDRLGAAARATVIRQFDARTNARARASLFAARGVTTWAPAI